MAKKYGCNLWLTSDDGLTKYLNTVLAQMKGELCALMQHTAEAGLPAGCMGRCSWNRGPSQ
jgi:hypothetical protein